MLYYLKDKDAVILFSVLKTIIKDEQLRTKEISDRQFQEPENICDVSLMNILKIKDFPGRLKNLIENFTTNS
jgi:hypothetical protein